MMLILYPIIKLLSASKKSFRLYTVSSLAHLELFIQVAYVHAKRANKKLEENL